MIVGFVEEQMEEEVSLLALAMLLFVLALILFVVELMIPSGGVLVVITAMLALGAIVVAFRHGMYTGLGMVSATFLAIPLMLWVFIEVWPRTPMGKRLIVEPKPADEFVWSDASGTEGVKSLVGTEGIAVDDMLPSGNVRIGEKNYEAFSETGPIDKGSKVRVLRLDVGRLVVMVVKDKPQTAPPMSAGTGLDRPANELNLESLEG